MMTELIDDTCTAGLCDNCKAEIKEEIDYLRDLLEADLKEDTRELLKDIIHGYICELYGVEEYEEDEPEVTIDSALGNTSGNFTNVHTHKITVARLEDLFKTLRGFSR